METVKLGLLIKKTKVARCGEHSYPVLSITKQDGIIMQSEKFKKRIASADTSDYKIIPRGKLVQGFISMREILASKTLWTTGLLALHTVYGI